jgi:hypothetical protein
MSHLIRGPCLKRLLYLSEFLLTIYSGYVIMFSHKMSRIFLSNDDITKSITDCSLSDADQCASLPAGDNKWLHICIFCVLKLEIFFLVLYFDRLN